MSLKELTEFVAQYWHKRTSKAGLLCGSILILILIFVVSQAVEPLLKEIGAITSEQGSVQFYYIICLCSLGVCEVVWLLAWLYWRNILVPNQGAILVVFAPWAEDDHQGIVRKLYRQFNIELAARGLHSRIHAKLLPPEEQILNNDDADRIMATHTARLVIFGRVGKGGIKGKNAEGFSEISFKINHSIAQEDANLLASSFSIDDFQIRDENSMVDPHFASKNLSDCACVFIGIGLTAENKFDIARQMWRNLFDKINSQPRDASSVKQNQFRLLINRWFQWNEFCSLIEFYIKNVADKITSHSVDSHVAYCQERLDFLMKLNSKSPEYLHCNATLKFHRGLTKEAIHILDEIEKSYPESLHPIFSRPFLTLWQRKYKPALRYFKRLSGLKKSPPPQFILSVISFYDSLIVQYPDRHELKFGSAFINDLFCDPAIARENYNSFLEAVQNDELILPLSSFASDRLKVLENSPTNVEIK
jgi:hypothetical protein